jgi:hypothetical protein
MSTGRPQNLGRFKQRSANTKILCDAGLLIAAGTLLCINIRYYRPHLAIFGTAQRGCT